MVFNKNISFFYFVSLLVSMDCADSRTLITFTQIMQHFCAFYIYRKITKSILFYNIKLFMTNNAKEEVRFYNLWIKLDESCNSYLYIDDMKKEYLSTNSLFLLPILKENVYVWDLLIFVNQIKNIKLLICLVQTHTPCWARPMIISSVQFSDRLYTASEFSEISPNYLFRF